MSQLPALLAALMAMNAIAKEMQTQVKNGSKVHDVTDGSLQMWTKSNNDEKVVASLLDSDPWTMHTTWGASSNETAEPGLKKCTEMTTKGKLGATALGSVAMGEVTILPPAVLLNTRDETPFVGPLMSKRRGSRSVSVIPLHGSIADLTSTNWPMTMHFANTASLLRCFSALLSQ